MCRKIKKIVTFFVLLLITISLIPSMAFAFDTKVIDWAIRELCGHITGNLGGLLVTVAGFGAIVSAALGSFRVTYSAIIVAVGAYAISSIESLYFSSAAVECDKGADSSTEAGGGGNNGGGATDGGGGGIRKAETISQTPETDPFASLD